jgi:hypothetical protein
MTEAEDRALVCGFGDVSARLAGLAWELGQPAAMLLEGEGAAAGSFALEEGGDAATVAVSAGDQVLEAVLPPEIDPVQLTPEEGAGPAFTVTPCSAEVRLEGSGQTTQCRGQISRWTADPLEGAQTFRYVAVEAADGGLLIATARGEPGIPGHGDERVSAWLIDSEGQQRRYEEALISTQYDGEERPNRVGIELWPGEDSPPIRVACSLLGGVDAGDGWAGILHAHSDGAEGLGTYLLRRA